MKSALEHIIDLTSIIFNLFTLGQMQLGRYSSHCVGKESDPMYACLLRYHQVTLYWRILTSQMDVMAVFCIICNPIHVMLCKSELKVDDCNLRGSLAYVYLRSSFVHSQDKAQSREPVAVSSSSGAGSHCCLPGSLHLRPRLRSQRRACSGAAWVSAFTHAWVSLEDCWPPPPAKNWWMSRRSNVIGSFFFERWK